MKKILLIAASALLAYLMMVWFTPNLLTIHDARRWILRGSLSAIGLLAAAVILWFLWKQKKAETAEEEPAEAALGQTDVDVLVREANAKLAAAGLGKIGALPVVLFVGAPGSAKTSTVVNGGLNAELLAGRVHQDNVIAPTTVANLWFARRAVLADVGGPALADQGQWTQIIRRLRPAKLGAVVGQKGQAPRAFVVCVDIESLAREGADASAAAARNLRRRLGDFAQALGIHLPTYVLFTRMDRVPFFTEYVRNLSSEEAAQVLGATLPMIPYDAGIYAQEAGARIATAFDELYHSLCHFRPEYLSREHDPAQLPGIYEFPRELRKLRRQIVDFLTELCRPSQLATGPFLRGFYFSGVRPVVVQENAPAVAAARAPEPQSRATAQDATSIFKGGFEVPAGPSPVTPRQVAGSRRVPQWTFVTRFLQNVVLEDRLAMGASAASTKASFARRALFLTATVLCLGASVAFLVSYLRNRALENRVRQAASGILTVQAAPNAVPSVDSLRRLESLRESLQLLARHNREGAPWSYRWGLYAGDGLYPDVRRLYFNSFSKLLLGYTQGQLLADLRQLPAPPKTGPPYQPTYDTLKAYLITTSHPQHSTKEFLSPVLLNRWREGRPTVTPPHAELAQRQFDFYSQELAIANPLPRANDKPVTEHAQRYLRSFGDNRRIYQQMVANASKATEPVNFNRKFSGSAAFVTERYEVPGAFTKPGWEFLKKQIQDPSQYFSGDDWVLGDQKGGQIDRAQLEKDVQRWYPEDLLNHWRNYARGAAVVKYDDFKDASQKLSTLSAGNQSPLVALFWLASQHTTPDVPGTEAFRPFHAVAPPGTADTLAASTEAYVRALSALQISVDEVAKNANNDAAKAQVQTDATAALKALADVRNRFGMNADRLISDSSRKLLEDPIVNITRLLNDLEPVALNKKGKGLCDQAGALWRKYPFSANAAAQATIPEVNAIFRKPDGSLWKLYNESLQKALVKRENRYERTQETINPRFVEFFNRAAAFSEALYPEGAQEPRLTFSLKPVPTEGIQGTALNVNGQNLTYSGGTPAAKQFTWQGSSASVVSATVRFGNSADFEWSSDKGLWAIFQFFQKAERWQPAGEGHVVDWLMRAGIKNEPMRLHGNPLTVRYEIDKAGSFFQKGYFSTMGCIAEIAR